MWGYTLKNFSKLKKILSNNTKLDGKANERVAKIILSKNYDNLKTIKKKVTVF